MEQWFSMESTSGYSVAWKAYLLTASDRTSLNRILVVRVQPW